MPLERNQMKFSVHIAGTIRRLAAHLPDTTIVEIPGPLTVRELALEIGIPDVLVVFALVNGKRTALQTPLTRSAEVSFFGTMAGG